MTQLIKWSGTSSLGGYEISPAGDVRFTSLAAVMPDKRSLEAWYQCDLKGYDVGGTQIALGKGQEPRIPYKEGQLEQLYNSLWRIWAIHNIPLVKELHKKAVTHGHLLTDEHAGNRMSQAKALAEIINDWIIKT